MEEGSTGGKLAEAVAVLEAVIFSGAMEGTVRDKGGEGKGEGTGMTTTGAAEAALDDVVGAGESSVSDLMVDAVTAISITATGGGGGVGVGPSNDLRVS